MTLKDQITEDMKTAMRAKDAPRLLTIRGLLAACKQREVDERIVLDDGSVVAIVDKLIKQRKDSITAFQQGGRNSLAAQDFRVNSGDQNLLIIRAVEDSDLSTWRQLLARAPQVIMGQIDGRGHLETIDVDALRVDTRHHVFDRAILARGIHALEDDKQRVALLRKKDILERS